MFLLKPKANCQRGNLGRAVHASLPQLLMTAVVLGVSTSFLGGGAARAANPTPCSFGPSPSGTPLCSSNLWDSIPTSDKQIQILASSVNGHLDFLDTLMPPPGYEGDYFQAIFTLDSSATGPTVRTIDYTIKIDPLSTYRFSKVDLSVLGVDGGTGTKDVYSSNSFLPADLIGSVTDTVQGSSTGPLNLTPYTQVWVRDTFSAPTAGAVNALQNNFMQEKINPVPGPLPLLGAGAAFGISRRIRRRIKGARVV